MCEVKKIIATKAVDAIKDMHISKLENVPLSVLPKDLLRKLIAEANRTYETKVPYKTLQKISSAILVSELDETVMNHPRIQTKQVIRLFEQQARANKNSEISSTEIFRTHLISLVEDLEEYTGKTLCDYNLHEGPLAHLDDKGITIMDIAKYFAGKEGKVSEILAHRT